MCTHTCVCMNACLKVSVLDIFLNYFLPYILREGFSLNLELPDGPPVSACLPGPGIAHMRLHTWVCMRVLESQI